MKKEKHVYKQTRGYENERIDSVSQVGIRIDTRLLDNLDKLSGSLGRTKSSMIREAIKDFVVKYSYTFEDECIEESLNNAM